jgi:heptosyltransferase-3
VKSPRILIVRRDNIGDLVCTTPLFTALRQRFPQAWIGALVNSYNAPVLHGNPDLDEIFAYTKLKHLEQGQSAFAALRSRVASLWRLRRMQLDYVVLATTDFVPRMARLARWLAPKQVVGFSDGSPSARRALDLPIAASQAAGRHEVERVYALARVFGIDGTPPPLKVVPDERELAAARATFGSRPPRVGLHISARRPLQRWPAERFAALAEKLQQEHGATVVLLWSPGPANHPTHPGDDDKARQILAIVASRARVIAYPTERLAQLIGALAACDAVVCSDGGASHIAAALGKPTVCFFGDSSVERWRPWRTGSRLIQPPTRSVAAISVDEVAAAFTSLAGDSGAFDLAEIDSQVRKEQP